MASLSPPPFAGHAAQWCKHLSLDGVPGAVVEVAKRAILDTVAVAVAGRGTRVASIAERIVPRCGDSHAGRSTVWAGGVHVPEAAAYCNATAAHALDMDDTCFSGIVHGSAVLVPAAFAVGEGEASSGRSLVEAFIAGSEIIYTLGACVGSALYDGGWWPTGYFGTVGAAAAAGRLKGWSEKEIGRAMVAAGLNATGFRAGTGTDAKPLGVGETTRRAFHAMALALSEARLPMNVFERNGGPLRAPLGKHVQFAQTRGLGNTWRLLDPGLVIKLYPLCSSAQAAVDATVALRERMSIDPERVVCITAWVTPMVRETLCFDRPDNECEAMFSLPFAIACALIDGTVAPQHLNEATLARRDIVRMMDRVSIETDSETFDLDGTPEAARIRVETGENSRWEETRLYPRGDPRSPVGERAFEHKVRCCLESRFEPSRAAEIMETAQALESLDDVRRFTSLLRIP